MTKFYKYDVSVRCYFAGWKWVCRGYKDAKDHEGTIMSEGTEGTRPKARKAGEAYKASRIYRDQNPDKEEKWWRREYNAEDRKTAGSAGEGEDVDRADEDGPGEG